MNTKNKILWGVILLVLVLQASFVFSQTSSDETQIVDYSDYFEDLSVEGQGLNYDNGKFEFISDSEDSYLIIGDNKFENIQPSTEDREASIEIGSKEEIKSAHFTTNSQGGTYYINGVEFEAPPNTEVIYSKEKGFQLKGTKVNEVRSSASISGENIELPSGQIMQEGKLNFDLNGNPYVKAGDSVVLDNIKFNEVGNDVFVYDGYCPDKEQNFYCFSQESLEFNSLEKGEVNVEFLGGNEFFNMKKRKYDVDENGNLIKFSREDSKEGWFEDENGYKYKKIADNKDSLKIQVKNGDSLKAENRVEKGLIPILKHDSVIGGDTSIKNNHMEINLDDRRISVKKLGPISKDMFSQGTGKKYQSVPFELSSDIPGSKGKLRMNSYRQYAMVSESGEKRIAYNEYNMPVSDRLRDNELQTFEGLRAKYPDMGFNVPKEYAGSTKMGWMTLKNGFNGTGSVPPFMTKVVDEFMKNEPLAQGVDEIDLVNSENMYHDGIKYYGKNKNKILLGRKYLDPFENFEEARREFVDSPVKELKHEAIHGHIENVMDSEMSTLSKKDERLKSLFERRGRVLDKLRSEGKVENKGELKDVRDKIDEMIWKRVYEEHGGNLVQEYNEIAVDSAENFFNSENAQTRVKEVASNFYKKEINEIMKNSPYKNAEDYLVKEEGFRKEDVKDLEARDYVYALSTLKTGNSGKLSGEGKERLSKISVVDIGWDETENEIKGENIVEKSKNLKKFQGVIEKSGERGKMCSKQITKILREETGIPCPYALWNYHDNYTSPEMSNYEELPTTWGEMKMGEQKKRVDSENEAVRETSRKLVQLSFDSGQIGKEKYEELIGGCKGKNCLNKRCIEYKITCCEKYSNSPNC